MRLAMFLPVAFLAGADGLVLLVPYCIFMALVTAFSVTMKRRQALEPVVVLHVPADFDLDLELEAAAL